MKQFIDGPSKTLKLLNTNEKENDEMNEENDIIPELDVLLDQINNQNENNDNHNNENVYNNKP